MVLIGPRQVNSLAKTTVTLFRVANLSPGMVTGVAEHVQRRTGAYWRDLAFGRLAPALFFSLFLARQLILLWGGIQGLRQPGDLLFVGQQLLALADKKQVARLAEPLDSSPEQRSEEHTSELQSRQYLVCRLLLEKKQKQQNTQSHAEACRAPRRHFRARIRIPQKTWIPTPGPQPARDGTNPGSPSHRRIILLARI